MMKKIIALLLTLTMLLSLAACGASAEEDPNAGKYMGTTAKALGMTMAISEVYPGETWLELKTGGKGTIMLDGDDFSIKWSVEGEKITVSVQGEDSVGTLSDGVITLDLMNMGVEMTFVKEGMEAPAAAATYNDAGYWDIIRMDSDDPESVISEEDMALAKEFGVMMYMELFEDGTGVLFMDEEMPVTWQDGSITFTEDALTVSYTVENGELVLDMFEAVFVMRKGEKPAESAEVAPAETEPEVTEPETEPPVVAEMEAAGFTDFMEVGVPYAYTTACSKDETKSTTAEVIVTSYEIFEEAEGYAPLEGYEWRVVKMEARFFDDNAWSYGMWVYTNNEDYYNAKLHDDTVEVVEETDDYKQKWYTINYTGQEMDAYEFYNYPVWGDWYTTEAGNSERICYLQWDILVPIGYDGCVVGLRDGRVEWPDGAYITDLNPDDFLLFRLN